MAPVTFTQYISGRVNTSALYAAVDPQTVLAVEEVEPDCNGKKVAILRKEGLPTLIVEEAFEEVLRALGIQP
jgi:hypothetical protein